MEKRLIKIFLSFLLIFDFVFASEINLSSDKYILYNLNDNEVLLKKDENKSTDIASLTKIMTVITAIENISDFDTKVTMTSEMTNNAWDVVTVGFKANEKVTFNDLLYGSILVSGADAVKGLAISISGSESKFVDLMNKKVKELNLNNTHFSNVVGLYDKENYSSAYDMAQILNYALKNKKFKEVFETRNYTFSNGQKATSTIEKYNKISKNNISFITGSKTGYIKVAGYCLASTATLNDVNYLFISLNSFSKENASHIKDHVKTYTYFNDNYGYKKIVEKDDIIATLKTKNAKEKEINIISNVEIKKYLKNTFDKSKVTYEYNGIDTVSYFTKKETKLGNVKINYEGEILSEFDLIYSQTLKFSLIKYLWNVKLYILIVVLLAFFMYKRKKIQKRKKRRKRMSLQ